MESLRARMMGGGKKIETPPLLDEAGDTMCVQRREEILRDLLNPMESYIMRLQSILIWEKPQQSIGVLIAVNGLFWLATTLRFYYLIGITGFVVVFLERWTNYIWPEIRVPPPPDQDTEGWTPVYPNLLSVPELTQYLARWWDYMAGYVDWYIQLRRTNHPKFFIVTILLLCTTATFGHYVSGYYILYFTVMGIMLLPCALYHNVLLHMYEKIQPYIREFEERFHIKRKKKSKGKRRGGATHADRDDDSSSDEIEEFVPSPDTQISATLEEAAEEPEDSDEEMTGLTPGLLPPAMPSLNPSRDHSDLELDDEPSHHGDLTSLTAGLTSLPDFDFEDSMSDLRSLALDETVEAGVSLPEEQPAGVGETRPAGSAEPIRFVSSHFKDDSSEEDEARLEEGLAFPDVSEAQSIEPAFSLPPEAPDMPDTLTQTLASALSSPLVAQTVSSLMTSTVAGLSSFKDSVIVAATGRNYDNNTGNHDNNTGIHDSNTGASTNSGAVGAQEPSLHTSVDTDTLEAEYEFLDQQDLDSLDVGKDERMEQGMEEGKDEGKAQGKEQGKEEGEG